VSQQSQPRILSVLPLDTGNSGLLDGIAEFMGACAAICLDKGQYRSGVTLTLDGDYQASYSLSWTQLTDKHYRTRADIQ
jgi:hypothetical protein